MMRQILLASIIALIALTTSAQAEDKTYTLKFNTVASPQQPEVKAMEVFATEVEKLSKGRIKVDVFHSGQLGNQQTQIIGTMRGSLDMAFTDPNTMAQFDRKVGVLGAAYLFRDLDHLYKVMDGPIGQEYFNGMARRQGIRPLDVWYLGTRQLSLRDKPVRTPEDMRGVKLRMPNSPLWIAMGKALGANPTPLGFNEVYLALKTGVVDGQDNPLPTNKAQKFYEVTKYITLTNHQLGMLWPSINEKLWQDLPEQYRTWMIKALHKARDYQNKLVLDEETALIGEFKTKYGITVITPDIGAFRRNARKAYAEFEPEWGAGAYDRIQAVK